MEFIAHAQLSKFGDASVLALPVRDNKTKSTYSAKKGDIIVDGLKEDSLRYEVVGVEATDEEYEGEAIFEYSLKLVQ